MQLKARVRPLQLAGWMLVIAASAAPADDGELGAAIRQALAHPQRPAGDRERDPQRKPAEVLSLMGIRPGMQIADLMAGGGWYTEVLARLVGPAGRVYSQNNKTSRANYGAELDRRIRESRLENVVRLDRELEDLELQPGELDAVFLVQFYHDTYWMKVDRAHMNHQIFEALRPGGVYCLIDHRATPGSLARDVRRLHRVDSQLVQQEVRAAGFVLEAESSLLTNPTDDHATSVFAPSIRGRSDRFVFKFRKPR